MRTETVTRDGWGVSVTSPVYDESGAYVGGVELHVYKFRAHPTPRRGEILQKGDGYGRRFATAGDAWRWALEHGYLQPYYPGTWCREHRRQHVFLGRRTGFCPGGVREELRAQYVPMWKVREHQKKREDLGLVGSSNIPWSSVEGIR